MQLTPQLTRFGAIPAWRSQLTTLALGRCRSTGMCRRLSSTFALLSCIGEQRHSSHPSARDLCRRGKGIEDGVL
jgi:hypothetical protein